LEILIVVVIVLDQCLIIDPIFFKLCVVGSYIKYCCMCPYKVIAICKIGIYPLLSPSQLQTPTRLSNGVFLHPNLEKSDVITINIVVH